MIELSNDNGVYVLTMNNGANTICLDWQAEMLQALNVVEGTWGKGTALVMAGEGKFFSNGVNMEAMSEYDEHDMKTFARTMLEIHRRLMALPFPTVAAINGHAFAGGAFLALSLDYRIMREDRGWICISEVDAGVAIPPPMMDILHAKLPPASVRDAVLTGRRYTADEALKAGFVDGAENPELLLNHALQLAASLTGKEPGIFRTLKQTLYSDLVARFE